VTLGVGRTVVKL